MEKKVKHIIHLVFLLVFSAGWFCSCHDWEDDTPPSKDSETVRATFSLKMPSGSNVSPVTYAASEEDENRITDIDVLVFKPDAGASSGWVYAYRAQASGTAIRDKGGYSTKEFTVTLIANAAQQNLVILANVRSLVDALSLAPGADRDQLLSQLVAVNSGRWEARLGTGGSGSFTPFPMWGETTQIISSTTQEITGVTLLRSIARVEVALDNAVNNFVLNKVYIYNSKNRCRVVPDRANLAADGKSVTAATVPAGAGNNTPLEYTVATGARALEKSIFLCEAAAPSAGQLDKATCIIVGGTYDGAMNYYRIDLMQKDAGGNITENFRDFLRNHSYRVLVSNVSGPGYSTPDEAFNSKPVNIAAEITDWDDGGIGFIVFDGQYVLSVTPLFSFDYKAITAEGDINRLQLFTDYPGGWTIESITDDTGNDITWLDVMQGNTPSRSGAAGVAGNRWIKLDANSMPDIRTAYITVQAGRMRYKVVVTQAKQIYLNDPVPASFNFEPAEQTDQAFTVITNSTETAATLSYSLDGANKVAKPDWITVYDPIRSGSGEFTFTVSFSVDDNSSALTGRACYIHITVEGLEKSVRVGQGTEIMYVGMFGGALTEITSGVWQFERPLYVQGTNESEGIAWSANNTTLQDDTDDTDGKTNTFNLYKDALSNPAAELCFKKNANYTTITGVNHANYMWYLPAQKQLMAIWAVHNSFEGTSKFGRNYYWNSTETVASHAWCMYFIDAGIISNNKTVSYRVRCVREIP